MAGAYLDPTPTEPPGLSPALTIAASVTVGDWTESAVGGEKCNVRPTPGGFCPDFGVFKHLQPGRGMAIFLDRDI